jgi:hypothetical protein
MNDEPKLASVIGPGHGQAKRRSSITEIDFKHLGVRIAQACPLTWNAITGKRYLLPTHRQPDYYNQEILDNLLAFFLATYIAGDYGEKPDHIIRLMYLSAVLGIKEQRPIYYLERELGEALMRTQLPGDLVTDDIHWRRTHMRIMLPKGLITIERPDGPRRDAMFLDIGKAKSGELQRLPEIYTRELANFAMQHGRLTSRNIATPIFDKDGLMVCTQLSGDINQDPGLNYGVVRPFEGRKINEIKVGGHFDTGAICDETDDELMDRMEHLAVNILLFMGSVPLEYEPEKKDLIRKMRQVNDRLIPALWAAKFVGRSQYRPSQKPHYHSAQFSGRKMPQHWRAGHWKRQHFGVKWGESKLIWIEPYQTLGPPEEEAQKSS